MRGLSSVPQPFNPEINLNDVIDAIRQTDPATYQSFQSNHPEASSTMTSSFPPTNATPNAKAMDLSRAKKHAYVKIAEQPASKGLRFRYECEGRSAGCIPGVSSTNDKKSFPTIQVVGYKGRAVVVVSLVTSEAPYKPHPHNLVGKEGCSKGVCTIELDSDTMSCSFPSLGIQCVKKKEIEESLKLRQQIRVDPFQTGFAHKDNNPQSIDLNCLRLCFQVFLEGNEKGAFTFALKPVVSDPIFDKKVKNELIICRMTDCSASVAGGKEILLFCEKVTKDDIEVRFYQEIEGQVVWEGYGEFQPSDVHKQYGICFRTPRYLNLETEVNTSVYIQLRRPSDGAVSDPRPFELTPIAPRWAAKRMKPNAMHMFHSILNTDHKQAAEELRRKVPASSTLTSPGAVLASPDSSTMNPFMVSVQQVQVQPGAGNLGGAGVSSQITQPIQLVHASTFPPPPGSGIQNNPPSPVRSMVTCPTPDLPPPPTPLPSSIAEPEIPAKIPQKAPNMNLRAISNANLASMPSTPTPQAPTPTSVASMASDVPMVTTAGDLYEDIEQVVYDEVDLKYDKMDFNSEPPLPPIRKKPLQTSQVNTVPPTIPIDEPDRPLPETPSKKSLISKLKPKSKKPKEEAQACVLEVPTAIVTPSPHGGENAPRPSASLFQRLFHRSKSVEQKPLSYSATSVSGNALSEPPVPPHRDDNGNEASNQIDDLQINEFMNEAGNLDNLDSMVTDFANEYMNETSMDQIGAAEIENNGNNCGNPVKS